LGVHWGSLGAGVWGGGDDSGGTVKKKRARTPEGRFRENMKSQRRRRKNASRTIGGAHPGQSSTSSGKKALWAEKREGAVPRRDQSRPIRKDRDMQGVIRS